MAHDSGQLDCGGRQVIWGAVYLGQMLSGAMDAVRCSALEVFLGRGGGCWGEEMYAHSFFSMVLI